MRKMRVLLVDDDEQQCQILQLILTSAGYFVTTALSGKAALAAMQKEQFDIVVTDLAMPEMNGIELLEQIKRKDDPCKILLLTGYGSIANAVEAMKKGAEAYIIKSHGPEELLAELQRIEKVIKLENAHTILEEQKKGQITMLESQSPEFQKMLRILEKSADSPANIFILGESGVGKEVLAAHIHQISRPSQNFLAVNCHALSASIIESELFGHEKGAFTGAAQRHRGRFEAVDGGTLLLDEIGDIPLETQAKLLRTLESRKIERMGSNQSVDVEFRLISATNVNLQKAIKEGKFREDLFYRLSSITVEVPPLRRRREDIPALIEFFLHKFSREMKKEVEPLAKNIWDALLNYSYPGNVRELKNLIERLVVLSVNGVVSEDDLPEFFLGNPYSELETTHDVGSTSLRVARAKAEHAHILWALGQTGNNVTQAAHLLEISPRQLFNKIKEYSIETK